MKEQEKRVSLLFEEEDVFTAQKYLRDLATGRDPFGGEELSGDEVLREPALVDALNLAADLLEAWQENGGFNKVLPERERPFEISQADRGKIRISDTPIGITSLANNIKKVLPYDMKPVRYTNIANWLLYIGALTWESDNNGHRKRYATPLGGELGIRVVERTATDGSIYKKNVYEARAQQFIIDNLESIMTYQSQEAVREAAERVEASKNESAEKTSEKKQPEEPETKTPKEESADA